MKHDQFSEYTQLAIQAALKAGEILKDGFGKVLTVTEKPGKQNFVTEYDHASEDCIISIIKKQYSNHNFLAEESGLSDQIEETVLWIIDPLDGTTNFVHQIPIVTISIAAYQGATGLSGVIYQPYTDELFVAEKGKGAFLNGKQISVSTTEQIKDCLFVGSLPYDSSAIPILGLEDLLQFSRDGATFRNYGSAALTLAYVAAGKVDACWLYNLYPWDFAAGKLLVEEARGAFTKFNKDPEMVHSAANVLATNKPLHQKFNKILRY